MTRHISQNVFSSGLVIIMLRMICVVRQIWEKLGYQTVIVLVPVGALEIFGKSHDMSIIINLLTTKPLFSQTILSD